MSSLRVSATYNVPKEFVFKTLSSAEDWTRLSLGAKAELTPEVGKPFSLYDGYVKGEVLAIDAPESISLTWRFGDWEDNQFSKVKILFIAKSPSSCEVAIEQSGIPATDKFGNGNLTMKCSEGFEQQVFLRLEKVIGFPRDRQ